MNQSIVAVSLLIWALLPAAPSRADGKPETAKQRTLLLVDDHDVLYRAGTRRVIHPLKRHGDNPIIKSENPWELLMAYNSVQRNAETGKYQMWYQAWSGEKAQDKTQTCVVAYAESDDGIRFTKPELGLFPYNGVKQTNIVLVGNGGHSYRYGASVLVDPRDKDPAKRYKMAYFDWAFDEGKEYPGTCVAFSPDGIHWTKHPKAPLSRVAYVDATGSPVPFTDDGRPWQLALTMSDAVDVFYDPVRKVFANYAKMWIEGPEGGLAWKHAMAKIESKDFVNWSKPELILAPDDLDPPHVEFHTSPVFFHKGVYFCLNQILDRAVQGGVINIELMTSRDGVRWERPFREQWFLPRSQGTEFDSGSMFTNCTPVVLDDEIRFYYGGYSMGAIDGSNDYVMGSGIGLATLPRDRFAGIEPAPTGRGALPADPTPHAGQVTLKPIDFSNLSKLMLNADASKGRVRVELLTADGFRVRGFSVDDAVPIVGDSLEHEVKWKGKTLGDLPPGKYMARIYLERATVYAVDLISR